MGGARTVTTASLSEHGQKRGYFFWGRGGRGACLVRHDNRTRTHAFQKMSAAHLVGERGEDTCTTHTSRKVWEQGTERGILVCGPRVVPYALPSPPQKQVLLIVLSSICPDGGFSHANK